tara:strand:- start:280 stop:645 length:366 start_codon:yes stop_codon:yes gene_type:complete
MGNDICCIDRKTYNKDENYKYYLEKPDAYLKKEKRNISFSRNNNCAISTLYVGTTITTIIVLCTGGPATLAISCVLGGGFAVYYIFSTRSDIKNIDMIDNILYERNENNYSILENTIIVKK